MLRFVGIVLAAVRIGRVLFPLNAGEAADPGDYAAELVGHLPGGVEGADATGGEAGDRVAVGVFAEIVFGGDLGEDFIAEEAGVAVAYGVIQRAAHGVFEGALPFVGIGFHEIEGRGVG